MKQPYCIMVRASAVFSDALKSQQSFPSPGALSSLDQLEPVGLIFPTVSVLGLYISKITCLCCHQCLFVLFQLENTLQEKLLSC